MLQSFRSLSQQQKILSNKVNENVQGFQDQKKRQHCIYHQEYGDLGTD